MGWRKTGQLQFYAPPGAQVTPCIRSPQVASAHTGSSPLVWPTAGVLSASCMHALHVYRATRAGPPQLLLSFLQFRPCMCVPSSCDARKRASAATRLAALLSRSKRDAALLSRPKVVGARDPPDLRTRASAVSMGPAAGVPRPLSDHACASTLKSPSNPPRRQPARG